jgi:CO dehydrogenase nickel-insertion accessory protein CooC1
MPSELQTLTEQLNIPLLGTIPANEELSEFEFSGKPLVELGDDSPVYQAVEKIMTRVI